MKISRRGSSADYGESSIELARPAFAWDQLNNCLTIKQSGVKDFSTKSKHSYTVRLTMTEINEIIHELSDAAVSNPRHFEKALEPSLKSILRIQAVTTGITNQRG